MSYIGDCRRRRIVKVVEGPVPEIYTGGKWQRLELFRGGVMRPRWYRRSIRYRFRFKLWPCRHEVVFRMRKCDFPTRAMANEPFAIAAWTGRDCPCFVCGPTEDKAASFRGPSGRVTSFVRPPRERKPARPKTPSASTDDIGPVELYCELERRDRAICRELAAMYDS